MPRSTASVVTLSFPAKSGQRALLEIDDADLAAAIAELAAGQPRSPLLAYLDGRRRVALTPAEVNAHVRALTGGAFTAKDFRTLRGTILAAEALARIGPVDTAEDRSQAARLAVACDGGRAGQHRRRWRAAATSTRASSRGTPGASFSTSRWLPRRRSGGCWGCRGELSASAPRARR